MVRRFQLSPQLIRTAQLAFTLFVTAYMLLVGGRVNATIQFNIQFVNTAAAVVVFVTWLGARSRREVVPCAIFVVNIDASGIAVENVPRRMSPHLHRLTLIVVSPRSNRSVRPERQTTRASRADRNGVGQI